MAPDAHTTHAAASIASATSLGAPIATSLGTPIAASPPDAAGAACAGPLPPLRPPRRRRAQLACDFCRASKIKCDRQEPICSACKQRDLPPEQCVRTGTVKLRRSIKRRSLPPASASAAASSSGPASTSRAGLDDLACVAVANSHRSAAPAAPSPEARLLPAGHPTASILTSTSGHASSAGTAGDHALRSPAQSTPTPASPAERTPRALVSYALSLLPQHKEQAMNVLEIYQVHFFPTNPMYNTRSMLARLDTLFSQGFDPSPANQSFWLSFLSWLCSITSTVYDLSPPTRLAIWGIVDDTSEAPVVAQLLAQTGADCFHAAKAVADRRPGTQSSEAALLLIQAGLTTVICSSLSGWPAGDPSILDACVRAARQQGFDRMGKLSAGPATMDRCERAATWLALCAQDWTAAPYGSYTLYPGTFTTEWDLGYEDVVSAAFLARPIPPEGEAFLPMTVEDWDMHATARMCIWPYYLGLSDLTRQLCDLGIHDADRRRHLPYSRVAEYDKRIQAEMDKRPGFLRIEMKKGDRPPEDVNMLKRLNFLVCQAAMLRVRSNSLLLSLHMPYLLMGYGKTTHFEYSIQLDMLQGRFLRNPTTLDETYSRLINDPLTPESFSVWRAVLCSRWLIYGMQRCYTHGFNMIRSWGFRHALFNSGLVLIFDLLWHTSCQGSIPIISPVDHAFNSKFGTNMDDQLAFVIDLLDNMSYRRGRFRSDRRQLEANTQGDVPSIAPVAADPRSDSLNFTGERLERLLVLAMRRNRIHGDGHASVEPYIQRYSSDMLGQIYSGGLTQDARAVTNIYKAQTPPSGPADAEVEVTQMGSPSAKPTTPQPLRAAAEAAAAARPAVSATTALYRPLADGDVPLAEQDVPAPDPPPTDFLDSLLQFAGDSSGLPIEAILADPLWLQPFGLTLGPSFAPSDAQ